MPTYTLVIGNKNYSSWSLRPWYLLKQFAIPFDEIRLVFDSEEFDQRIGDYNPARKVPVLIDGKRKIWESLAIMEYLAERHADLPIWPQDIDVRTHARVIASEMHAGFAAMREALPMNCRANGRRIEISPAVARDLTRIQSIWSECRETYQQQGPWLFGDFSAADAMYAPVASRFRTYGVELDSINSDYVETVLGSDRYQEWLAASLAEKEVVEHEEVGMA